MDSSTIYSPAVIDMLTVSARFCNFLEQLSAAGTTRRQLLDQLTRVLPLLYVKAILLPQVEPTDEIDTLAEIVTEDDYEEVRQSVWRLLQADDEYLEVFTPDMQFSEGATTRTISEDLADIYQDLKNFAAIYADRNEAAMPDAIAKVSDNFRTYWGQRLVNAMRPLHELTYNRPDKADDGEDQ